MRTLGLFFLSLFLLSLLVRAEVRLAILGEPETQEQEALLAAEISHLPVVLLERTEIARVLAEQRLSLAGLTAEQLPRIGRLLGADGVVFLSRTTGKEGAALALRLVAVHPGVVITSTREPIPEDPAAWSRDASAELNALLPKLAVKQEAAIPVSVVNLRATRTDREAPDLEREFTLLLNHRLTHEPAIFVLERDRLETLETEKNGEANDPFWTGDWLIDGTIERKIGDATQLTITLNLQPSGGGKATILHRDCQRDEGRAAVDALAVEVARVLQQTPTDQPWAAATEAAQYWREAKWAFKNEVFNEAAASAEAAWVLGQRNADVMALRIRAELLAGRPELLVPYQYPAEYVTHYQQERNFDWRAQIPITHGYRTHNVLKKIYDSMPPAEREARMHRTLRALELFRDYSPRYLGQASCLELATEALTVGGAMLEWFQQNDAAPNESRQSLTALLREVDSIAERNYAPLSQHAKPEAVEEFWLARTALTPIWADGPAQTLAVWRQALQAPLNARGGAELRVTLVHGHDLYPSLAAGPNQPSFLTPSSKFSGATPEPPPAGWSKFVAEFESSPFAGDRFMALFLRNSVAAHADEAAVASKSQAAFWDERANFANGKLPFKYWDLVCTDASDKSDPPFFDRFFIYLLQESTPISHEAFQALYNPHYYSRTVAGSIYAAILAHDARVRAKIGAHWILPEILHRADELTLRFPDLQRPANPGSALKVTRYWHPYLLEEFQNDEGHRFKCEFKETIYAENKLWLFVTDVGFSRGPNTPEPRYLFGIDLKTFQTETISFPPPPPLAEPRKALWGGFNLAVGTDFIFVCGEATLSRYDRQSKTWHYYPQLPGVYTQPWRIGDRLYVQVNNDPAGFKDQRFGELMELDVLTDKVVLLASDRRQPPASPLDAWPFDVLTVRGAADGRVFFRGLARPSDSKYNYAAYDPLRQQWSVVDRAAWQSTTGFDPAHQALATDDAEWTIESNRDSSASWMLKAKGRRVPFQCEFSESDRALLVKNGSNPPQTVMEKNIFPGLPMAPLAYATPEGVAVSQVFEMPGFWFIPITDLPPAQTK